MSQAAIDTEELIKSAAKKVFLKKGLAGTRLQEIADEAGIGRTALHYYFRSKEKLFQVVWKEAFQQISKRGIKLTNENLSIVEKMQAFAAGYFENSMSQPELDIFMINEFNNNPEMMSDLILNATGMNFANPLYKDIEKAVKKGELKGDAKQIFISLISMCLFSFAAKAMLQSILKLSHAEYMQLIEQRKDYINNFLATAFK